MQATDIKSAMKQAGWRYDKLTHGFTKGHMWVGWDQAVRAIEAAETGVKREEDMPQSRMIAEVVAKVENDPR
jgi:hypothetical protein